MKAVNMVNLTLESNQTISSKILNIAIEVYSLIML